MDASTCVVVFFLLAGIDYDIDIQKTVQHVRAQRSGMVQTEAQYRLIYLAMMHHIEMLRTRTHAEMQYTTSGTTYDNLMYPPGKGAAMVAGGCAGAPPAIAR